MERAIVPLSTYRRGLAKQRGLPTPVRFRLYPMLRRGLYLTVQVWPSLQSMRSYLSATYPGSRPYHRTLGMCSSFKVVAYRKGKRSRARGIFAELNLCAANLTMRIVTHELQHATLAYARRVKLDLAAIGNDSELTTKVSNVEEALCEVHGNLCSAFVQRTISLGFYGEQQQTPWKPFARQVA